QNPTTLAAQLNEPVSKAPRPIPTSPSAQVNQQGPSSDPNVESSSEVDLTAPDNSFIQVLSNDESDDSDDDFDPLFFWHGDLHVLFESTTGGSSVEVWNDQQEWVIRSWKLFPFSGVHVLETFTGKILYMFADTPYPLSASLMKKMLKHKLEVEIDGIGNDMTHAEQLIAFIKNRLAACLSSA
ncbi:hypothetical protein Tco_0478336, partial [Tanacetum coccineum]